MEAGARHTPLDAHGVVRDVVVQGMTLSLFPMLAVMGGTLGVMGAPPLAFGVLSLAGLQAIAVLWLLRRGRGLAGRVLFLVSSYVLITMLAVVFGAGAHQQYFLVPGIGMSFLFIRPDRPSVRWALSLIAVPIAVGVGIAQQLVPPLITMPPDALAVFAAVNDVSTLATAGLMWVLFSQQADRQITQIQHQREALRRTNVALDGFARVTSHDLKTPLGGIVGLVGLLRGEGLTPPQQELVGLIEETSHEMDRLIGQLLQRARAGGQDEAAPVDPDVLIGQLLRETPRRGLRVVYQPLGEVVCTWEVALRQVLANLISNAFKYHDKPDGTVWISIGRDGDALDILVRDDGPGIPTEQHQEIFRLFATVHGTDRADSTGVGLATVHECVEQVGATVSVDSALGAGAAFRVRWPLVSHAQHAGYPH